MIKQIKAHLNKSIQSILGQKVEFVKQDEQAFTRKRRLSLETMIRTILGMGGKSLSKELLDARLTVSNSAFVQRRYSDKNLKLSMLYLKNLQHLFHLTPIFRYSLQMGAISVFLEIPWIQKPLSNPKRMLNPIISYT